MDVVLALRHIDPERTTLRGMLGWGGRGGGVGRKDVNGGCGVLPREPRVCGVAATCT